MKQTFFLFIIFTITLPLSAAYRRGIASADDMNKVLDVATKVIDLCEKHDIETKATSELDIERLENSDDPLPLSELRTIVRETLQQSLKELAKFMKEEYQSVKHKKLNLIDHREACYKAAERIEDDNIDPEYLIAEEGYSSDDIPDTGYRESGYLEDGYDIGVAEAALKECKDSEETIASLQVEIEDLYESLE